MKRKKSLQDKISRVVYSLTTMTLVIMAVVMFIMLFVLRGTFISSSTSAGEKAEKRSSSTVTDQIRSSLLKSAISNANLADKSLEDFKESVEIVAKTVTSMYEHKDEYGPREVPLPDASKDGQLSMQLLHSEKTDLSDPATAAELGLVANIQDTLVAINDNNPNMSSNYVATKSGIMLQADYIAAKKFDENGKILPYEADTRPWYIGASENRKPFFTSLAKDIHTGNLCVMCGVPIFDSTDNKTKQFMGVSGAGMYLNELAQTVAAAKIGEQGYALMLDGEGKMIFSSANGDVESIDPDEQTDIREGSSDSFAALVTRAIEGREGVDVVDMIGENYYVAYAPLKTIGWSFLALIPEDEVEEPTQRLVADLQESTDESVDSSNTQIWITIIIVIVIVIILYVLAVILSRRSSKRLVRQVKALTEKVGQIEGDELDFIWEEDTGDEIQVLAEAFGSLTERMKQYIRDITAITAEKERIGAELNVATQIQASMVPTNFDDYAGLKEFDLFASMTPAKEVGGDFYDFFMTDVKHLVLVMADVSGKGVPAALFMAKAKTALKTRSMMGGSPADILSDVNDQMCEGNEAELFVTVWLAIIDLSTGEGMAANAGHEHPALCHKDGSFEMIKYKHSPAVATMEGMPFREHEFKLEPGDTLFVYTDGATEATDANNELFGEDRLVETLNSKPGLKPDELLAHVKEDIDAFVGEAPQFDDLTMMAVTYFGPR